MAVPASLHGLEDLDEQLRERLASLEDGVLLHDAKGVIRAASPGAFRLLGVSERALIGTSSPLELGVPFDESGRAISVQDCPARRCRQERARQAETVIRLERADGRVIWLAFTATPLFSETSFHGVVTSFVDVTERHLADATRQRLYEAAREALRTRDEFLAVAAHELRTPLTALQINVQSLERNIDSGKVEPPAIREKLRATSRQLVRLNFLVDMLLDVTRISTGRLELKREPVDLALLVQEAVERCQRELEEVGCELRARVEPGLVGRWDALRLEQVLSNLLSNAAKYGRGHPVSLELTRDGEAAVLTVRDLGIGIAPEDQARIFERFERASAEPEYRGLGLGLWVVREIVEAHGGQISLTSQPGRGTTFRVRLPLGEGEHP